MDQIGFIMLVWLLIAAIIALRGVYLDYRLCRIVHQKHPDVDYRIVRAFLKREEKKGTCDPEFSHLKRAVFRTLMASFLMGLAWIFVFFVIVIVTR